MSTGCPDYGLRTALLRVTINPREQLIVPAINKGNMLRGSFGYAFRRLCCVPQCRDSRVCPLNGSCPYKIIFEPSPPAGSDRLSKYQDIPRPFVFRAPATSKTRFEPDESFKFSLVLIGRAIEFLPYFVLSFREIVETGWGLNRAKCRLERVEEVALSNNSTGTHEVYTAESAVFRGVTGASAAEWIGSRLESLGTTERITLRFLTPTLLRADGDVVRRPEFHHVFKRVRDRINALCVFFGDGPVEADFRGLGERAERVRTVSADFEWMDRARTSSRTGQRHELSGFVGEATYEGNLTEFLPWLVLGELTHIGKHTAWGCGWVEIENLKVNQVDIRCSS